MGIDIKGLAPKLVAGTAIIGGAALTVPGVLNANAAIYGEQPGDAGKYVDRLDAEAQRQGVELDRQFVDPAIDRYDHALSIYRDAAFATTGLAGLAVIGGTVGALTTGTVGKVAGRTGLAAAAGAGIAALVTAYEYADLGDRVGSVGTEMSDAGDRAAQEVQARRTAEQQRFIDFNRDYLTSHGYINPDGSPVAVAPSTSTALSTTPQLPPLPVDGAVTPGIDAGWARSDD